jgi:hypothetical protein
MSIGAHHVEDDGAHCCPELGAGPISLANRIDDAVNSLGENASSRVAKCGTDVLLEVLEGQKN